VEGGAGHFGAPVGKFVRIALTTAQVRDPDLDIISIFVGQVLNRAKLQSKERNGFNPLTRDVDVWPLQDRFNSIVKATADSIEVSNFIPAIDEFQDDDFVDTNHFSAKGSAKFALMITPIVKSSCK